MDAQTPTPSVHGQEDQAASGRGIVVAVLLWLVTVAAGVGGSWLVFDLAEYEGDFLSWYAVFAVPFGLLLGGAAVASMLAADRRAPVPLVLAASIIVGLAVYAVPGFLGSQSAQEAAGEECSAEEVAQLEALSFSDDLDHKPTGTQHGQCYVTYTIGQTGQQAWVVLSQELVASGWQHASEPDWKSRPSGDPYRPYQVLHQGDFTLLVEPEGSPGWPEGALGESGDGATTFALVISTGRH